MYILYVYNIYFSTCIYFTLEVLYIVLKCFQLTKNVCPLPLKKISFKTHSPTCRQCWSWGGVAIRHCFSRWSGAPLLFSRVLQLKQERRSGSLEKRKNGLRLGYFVINLVFGYRYNYKIKMGRRAYLKFSGCGATSLIPVLIIYFVISV